MSFVTSYRYFHFLSNTELPYLKARTWKILRYVATACVSTENVIVLVAITCSKPAMRGILVYRRQLSIHTTQRRVCETPAMIVTYSNGARRPCHRHNPDVAPAAAASWCALRHV